MNGFVDIRGGPSADGAAAGRTLRYKMPKFLARADDEIGRGALGRTAGAWTPFAVILREDYGWTDAVTGGPVLPQTMIAVMQNVEQLLIRGDSVVCGGGTSAEEGTGMEVVYIQNVTLRLPRR